MKPKAPTPKQVAQFQQANSLHQAGQLTEALAVYKKLLQEFSRDPELLERIGAITLQQGQPEQALPFFERSLQIAPQRALTHCHRGIALGQLQRPDQALAAYNRAISLKADYADAYINRGIVFYQLQHAAEAIADFRQAIALRPDHALAYQYRGLACLQNNQPEQAVADCQRAIALNPLDAEACVNLGDVQQALHQSDAALQSYERAIALNPAYALAHFNRGNILQDLRQPRQALNSYDAALQLGLATANVLINKGIVCQELKQYDDALNCFDQAISLDSRSLPAYVNKAVLLQNLKRLEASLANFRMALQLDADDEFVYGQYLFNKLQLCDWHELEAELAELFAKIGQGRRVAMPWHMLAFTDHPALQQQVAACWMQDKFPPARAVVDAIKPAPHDKIRIAYVSADFYIHPVAVLSAGLFERHDHNRFEIFGFYYGHDKDAMTDRLAATFDRFIDITGLADQQVVQLARSLGIDIAIDLAGYTGDSRTALFAERLAPVQVSYLGYAGSMAADYIDYMIADRVLIPESSRSHYTENIVYLPNSFQANDHTRRIADRLFSRQQFGLPEQGFVYCCFNNSYKITPATFGIWMRILARVAGSVLWLSVDNAVAMVNLKQAAAEAGVDPDRLVMAPRMDSAEEHLARLKLADLFLDTLPYNAHTTASDALWAGLPLLTCPGQSYASRVAASLLSALRLPELITDSLEDYAALAIELAENPARLAGVRGRLQQNRQTAPLFDTALFTRHLEAAYSHIYRQHQAGLPKADFDVPSAG